MAAGPIQGVGIGLRACHYRHIEKQRPAVPWFEILVDNYLGKGGASWRHLETLRQDYPYTFHGVGLSLGSTDPLDLAYLDRLRHLMQCFAPTHVSEHLCWTGVGGQYSHELLPLPYTEAAIAWVAERVMRSQDYLGHRLLLENVSSYTHYRHSEMTEWEFLAAVVERADCDILLDINNIYVSAYNHDFDPAHYLAGIPVARVREMHLAGYEDRGDYLLDTHGARVQDPVWSLYGQALQRFGSVPTLIEWDSDIPAFEVLQAEAARALAYQRNLEQDVA